MQDYSLMTVVSVETVMENMESHRTVNVKLNQIGMLCTDLNI